MTTTLIWGKQVVTRITGTSSAEVITDGAVVQRDGEIIEIGSYRDMRAKYEVDEEIGGSNQVVIPGLINAHHHVGLTPFQLGALDAPLEACIILRWAMRDRSEERRAGIECSARWSPYHVTQKYYLL